MKQFLITAIDTDAGKTIATGLLAKAFLSKGLNVVTAKLAQTGCEGISIDIQEHRRVMNVGLLPHDLDGTTCPYIFSFPASPHFSAQLEQKEIIPETIAEKMALLGQSFDYVLIEGVGGMMVPLTPDYLVSDFAHDYKLPVVLVTSARLGSINHTLLTLEHCFNRHLNVVAIVFNHYPKAPEAISNDARAMIRQFAIKYFPEIIWFDLPVCSNDAEFNPSSWHQAIDRLIRD